MTPKQQEQLRWELDALKGESENASSQCHELSLDLKRMEARFAGLAQLLGEIVESHDKEEKADD